MLKISTVTVIGANGAMGAKVAGIFASFGQATVYMVCRDIDDAKGAIQKAVESVHADSIAGRLIPMDYSMLEECIDNSDLVYESVAEGFDIKRNILLEIGKCAKPDVFIATGTSGLSVTALAEILPLHLRARFFGIHMFNPPYSLTLCELIPTRYSDCVVLEQVKNYLQSMLLRKVVQVKDSPAFLANRIGFMFMNRALQLADEFRSRGGIDYIDAIFGSFTGRSMPPLKTIDFVGLDVHKAINHNIYIYIYTADYNFMAFELPNFAKRLIDEGKLGRKTGQGLYKQQVDCNGVKRKMVYDITANAYRDVADYRFPYAEKMTKAIRVGDYRSAIQALISDRACEADLCLDLLLMYVIYALYVSNEVCNDIFSADDAISSGFNWCPPLAMYEAISSVTHFCDLVNERLGNNSNESLVLESLVSKIPSSNYHYGQYFRSV
jgi:3-hydroxyacyl-CoA dehydrogenase